ncbi:hypothetical protein CBR_g22152 [Chara braunii]|uniref:Integrase catalytic domain-containing protein n=1 Tax=Chara braunii TaxID=69332 RepID=A0A388L256_CHABU|nr:hypothetical protein CBR_g22152 [Chara braunii]|eukprot:GBG76404.1 hypothetical protein CBR_g22152 [Chara braunii]
MFEVIRRLQAKDKKTSAEFELVNGLLFLEKAGNKRLCVPNSESLRSLFLGECHDAIGRFGYKKTATNLLQRLWWPTMMRDAQLYVETCQVCQRDKPRTQAPLGLLKPLPIPERPGESLSMDFMDTLITSKSGMRHIFVIVDRFSKYARVDTRGGNSTTPYTKEQEEEAAKILAEQTAKKEQREVVKQAKKLALLQEKAAKRKKLEEELERVKKEEEKMKSVDAEEEEEEKKVEEEVPLTRRSIRDSGETSGTKKKATWLEKKVSEWVANLSLGEEEEVMLYFPREEQEAVVKELEVEEDPLKRQTIEDEKELEWKLRLTRERKKNVEAASKAVKELEEVRQLRVQMEAQAELKGKIEVMAKSIERLARAQEEQYQFGRSQDIAVRSIRLGFREFVREMLMHVGSEVQARLESTE